MRNIVLASVPVLGLVLACSGDPKGIKAAAPAVVGGCDAKTLPYFVSGHENPICMEGAYVQFLACVKETTVSGQNDEYGVSADHTTSGNASASYAGATGGLGVSNEKKNGQNGSGQSAYMSEYPTAAPRSYAMAVCARNYAYSSADGNRVAADEARLSYKLYEAYEHFHTCMAQRHSYWHPGSAGEKGTGGAGGAGGAAASTLSSTSTSTKPKIVRVLNAGIPGAGGVPNYDCEKCDPDVVFYNIEKRIADSCLAALQNELNDAKANLGKGVDPKRP
jgi:hypothetical protein